MLPPDAGSSCEATFGDALERSYERDGEEQCVIRQLDSAAGAVPTGPGWYVDDFSSRLREACGDFGGPVIEAAGVSLPRRARVECRTSPETIAGAPCSLRINSNDGCGPEGGRFACDLASYTCELRCGTSEDCGAGFVCDESHGVCTNAGCASE